MAERDSLQRFSYHGKTSVPRPLIPIRSSSLHRKGAVIRKRASITISKHPAPPPVHKKIKSVRFQVEAVLQQVIAEGDVEQLRELLGEHGKALIRRSDCTGRPLALRAVLQRQHNVLEVLVKEGVSLTTPDDDGWTALHAAVAKGDVKSVKVILEGNQPGLTNSRSLQNLRPIDIAKSYDLALLLLEADLELFRKELRVIFARSSTWQRFLTCTKDEGFIIVQMLERREAKKLYKKSDGSLLHLAARKNYPHLAVALLEKRLVNIDKRNAKGETPLHYAAKANSTDMIVVLKKYGADVTIADSKGNTAAFYASPFHCTWLLS